MGAGDELRDPAGLLVAAGAAGAAAASGLPAGMALGVGAAVLATKAVTGAVLDRRAAGRPGPAATASPAAPEPERPAPVADPRPEAPPMRAAGVPPVRDEATVEPAASVFRPEGEYWTIAYRGTTFRLKDAKGLRHLHRLLADPGREFHVADLATLPGAPAEEAPSPGRLDEEGLHAGGPSDAGAMLDPQAKEAYRRRLEDLRDEAEEARSWGDVEREARAEDEIAALAHELARAVGLHGSDRRAASATERARVNVTRAVKSAIDRIAEHDRSLGHHLSTTVRTGTFCAYAPDPADAPTWQL